MNRTPLDDMSLGEFFGAVRRILSGEQLREILSLRRTPTEKEDGSYVTEGDLLVQSLIISSAVEHFKNPHIISEEAIPGTTHSYENSVVLIVDPIDGTENFTSGLPEWGVSISCFQSGKHAGSLIGSPELETWLQTGEPMVRYSSRIRGLSSSLNKQQILEATEGFEYRILGCCVYNMINVIRGSFQSFENPKGAWSWDILGGLNLALEHGLAVTVEGVDYAGEYLEPNRKYRFKVENR